MDRFNFLIYSLLIYVLGVVFAQKTITTILRFLDKTKKPIIFIKEWFDVIFALVVATFLVYLVFSWWPLTNEDSQILIFSATAFTLFFQAVIGNRSYKYRNRPIIDVEFKENHPEFYHMTEMHIKNVRGEIIESIPTYYIRLNVKNIGKETLENVEVVLERVESEVASLKPFMSLNLSWAGFIIPIPNDIKRNVRIPRGQSRTLDIIEVMEPSQTASFSRRLEGENDFEAKRYKELAEGFRSCSIKPNTRSDIYPAGNYLFHLGVYADGIEPKHVKFSINYEGIWGTEGIEGMRSKHLQVTLA